MRELKTIDPAVHMHKWEEGSLGVEDVIGLFQYLIDTGEVWSLPERYSRQANELIDCGFCKRRDTKSQDDSQTVLGAIRPEEVR